jgi:hypothetical protein
MTLPNTATGGDPYQSSDDDSLWLVAPGETERKHFGYGYIGKLNLIQSLPWDKEQGEDPITKLTHPIPMWPKQVADLLSAGKPKNCGV